MFVLSWIKYVLLSGGDFIINWYRLSFNFLCYNKMSKGMDSCKLLLLVKMGNIIIFVNFFRYLVINLCYYKV